MKDQVQHLKAIGFSAVALNDEQSDQILKDVESGALTYVLTSPESMLNCSRWSSRRQ